MTSVTGEQDLCRQTAVSLLTSVNLPRAEDIAENDPVSIVFTSGTTGFAKGVTLSHRGILANANAAILSLRAYPEDVFINVLPLHHTYPATCSFIAPLSVGASTIIVEKLVGSVVIDDIRDAGGTFLIAVPLLYDKVMAAIDKGFRALPRPVFFRFLRKKAGLASVRMMVAGGGPLSPKTADFFDSFGFNIVHGYGMSENSPLISVNTPWHKRNASVGLPVKYTEVKIIEKDSMEKGTLKKDSQRVGEIAVKSPSVMLGYFENPEATAKIITADGWLKTGDLGYRDEKGFIYINGRLKTLLSAPGARTFTPRKSRPVLTTPA